MSSIADQHARHHRLIDIEEADSPEAAVLALMFRKAYERAAETARGPVLDLGCNTGYGTAILRTLSGSEVVGVDVSERAIATARERWGGEFRVADGAALPFPDGSFGTVTCFQVIEHIDRPGPFLAEVRRVLRPGGRAFFSTPNAATRLDPGQRPWNRFHVHEFTAAGLHDLLEPHFADVRVEGLFGTPEVEAIERARVARLRAIGRWRNRIARFLPLAVEDWLVRTARSILGRGRVGSPGAAAAFDTGDLRYEAGETADALDLLAVCTL